MGLLGVAGQVIDYGRALNKNQVQSAADASALAGASQLRPAGSTTPAST
jgi:Flp pilus assembly protein TadG